MRQVYKFAIATSIALIGLRCLTAQSACLNDSVRTIAGEFDSSLYVVFATAVSNIHLPESADGYFLDGDNTTIQILRVLKGPPAKVLMVFSENSSGRFPLDLNKPYILFLYLADDRLSVDNCGHSGPVARSSAVISAVQTLLANGARNR